MTRIRILFGLAAVALALGLWMAITAPPDSLQGEYSRLINIHVPSLWLAFLAFAVVGQLADHEIGHAHRIECWHSSLSP